MLLVTTAAVKYLEKMKVVIHKILGILWVCGATVNQLKDLHLLLWKASFPSGLEST